MSLASLARRLSLLGLAALCAVGIANRALAVEHVNLGDTVSGTTVAGVKEALPLHLTAGSVIDFDLRMAGGANPAVAILQPDRTPLEGLAGFVSLDSKGARLKGKKIPIEQSGRHYLVIAPGIQGAYSIKIKGKQVTKGSGSTLILFDPPTEFEFGAVPGVLLTVTAKRAPKSGLTPEVRFLKRPDGSEMNLGAAASHTINSKIDSYKSIPIDSLGTHVLGIATQAGLPGDFGVVSWVLKFPKVKPAKLTGADVVVDPILDAVNPNTGFDNLVYSGITITGDYFGLAPQVSIQGPGVNIPGTNVIRDDDTTLRFGVDLVGQPTGTYDLVVSYADGAEGRLAGGFTVAATPLPTAMVPDSGFDNESRAAVLQGTRFQSGMTVRLVSRTNGTVVQAVMGSITSTTAALTLPLLNATLGEYDIVATNPDLGTNTVESAFTVVRGPRLLGATPLLGHDNRSSFPVLLSGLSFAPGMTCRLEATGEAHRNAVVSDLTAVAATATFNLSGAPARIWSMRVTNPDGGTWVMAVPFVTALAPRVLSANPNRGFSTETLSGAIVNGSQFVVGVQVALEASGEPTIAATGEVINIGATTITSSLPLVGANGGARNVRVTNPDGGTEVLVDGFSILGTSTVAEGHDAGGRSAMIYNTDRSEYLVVYTVSNGGQRDIRARRMDPVTGLTMGSEIVLTVGAEDQFDPAVAWSPTLGRYLVVYSWNDPNPETENKVKVLGQFLLGDGTVDTEEENAIPVFARTSGGLSRPSIAWNPDREEWMIVWAWDVPDVDDIHYAVYDKGIFFGSVLVPGLVSGGVLIAETRPDGDGVINEHEFEPVVSYAAPVDLYLVAYTFNSTEKPSQGNPNPTDTGSDVRVRLYNGDFSAGPVLRTTITNMANENNRFESAPSAGYDDISGNFFVAWQYENADSTFDLRCRLISGSSRTLLGTGFTQVEQTGSTSASRPSVALDRTTGARTWLVAHAINHGTTTTSKVVVARVPEAATATGFGTLTYVEMAAALSGAAYSEPVVAARSNLSEILTGWALAGTAKPGVNAEVRFGK